MTDGSTIRKNTEEELIAGRPIDKVRIGEVPLVYANNVSTKMSLWDVIMDFGLITDATEESVSVRDLVTIVMSPQQAKSFADLLNRNIHQYEKNFGHIPDAQDAESRALESDLND